MMLPKAKKILIVLLAPSIFLVLVDFGLAASTASLGVSATVTSKNQCKFNTKNATLAFGAIDSFDSVDAVAATSLLFVCVGKDDPATFLVTHDNGLNESGPNAPRMAQTITGDFLPYEISISPMSGAVPKGVEQTLSVTGSVRSADYRTAVLGDYADTVTVSIFP